MSDVILTFLDLETTGLKQEEGHRIIEFAAGVWKYNTATKHCRKVGNTVVQRIDPQRSIDPGAQAVHGISLADLKGMPTIEDFMPKIHKMLAMSEIVIAHNGAGFDCPFVALEMIRLGYTLPKFKVFDTMLEGRGCTSYGKVPNLGELCWATGVVYDPESAHSAAYDVEVMEEAYWCGVQTKLFESPADFLNH